MRAYDSVNCFAYDQECSNEAMDAFLHEMDPLETNGLWGRFRSTSELLFPLMTSM